MAGKLLTQNQSSGSYIESGADKDQNIQALCEMAGGLASGEGQATWTQANSLTLSDTRITATTCRVILSCENALPPRGTWTVDPSTYAAGSVTVRSSEVETAGTRCNYIVIKK